MKKKVSIVISLIILTGYGLVSCEKNVEKTSTEDVDYFLSEIRPNYFENLNFDSIIIIKNIPNFKEKFYNTYYKLDREYKEGKFTSESDLKYLRLEGQYFSFYLLALTAAQLDSNLTFKQIHGDRSEGLFSKLKSSVPDFEHLEMQAMITAAKDVAYNAAYLNGVYNDKVYGFYLACYQVEQRVKNRNNLNNADVHKQVTDFTNVRLINYDLLPVWNLLMAQVTLTNYNDTLNTFDNPQLDVLFVNAQARLVAGFLPDLGGKYPEILGPIYRFDLSMKKIDWYLKKASLTALQIFYINSYLDNMKDAMEYVEITKGKLFNTWAIKNTYYARKQKWTELRNYFDNIAGLPKPELKSFINSKDFKKAYQCYSCHRESGL